MASRKAVLSVFHSGSLSPVVTRTPSRPSWRTCARARSGHAAAVPIAAMNAAVSFDHLVGAGEKRWLDPDPKGSSRPAIERERRQVNSFNREIARCSAGENPSDVSGDPTTEFTPVGPYPARAPLVTGST